MAGWGKNYGSKGKGYGSSKGDEWQHSSGYGGGKHGGGKYGGGKGWSSKNGNDEEQTTQKNLTKRILNHYQWASSILKPSLDSTNGSAFVKKHHEKHMPDDAFLKRDRVVKELTRDNAHIMRRPGTGLSELVGSLPHGYEILREMVDHFERVGVAELHEAFMKGGEELETALRTLNTYDRKDGKAKDYEEAFMKIHDWLMADKNKMWDSAARCCIASARLYLTSTSLLQLMAAISKPSHWAEQVPDELSEHKAFKKWKTDPKSLEKMAKAMGQLMAEKVDRDAEYSSSNAASTIFGRGSKRPAASSDDSGSDVKAKKSKKEKDQKKKKEKSSTSSSDSDKKQRKNPGDPDANPDNFEGTTQVSWEPAAVPVFIGMTLMLTKNINKEIDFVNGMTATVEGLYNSGVRVRTRTGYEVMVFPWTDEEHQVFFPMRLGYANTLMKMQGATLPHLTIWLDAPNVEAAGYVALSRVEYDAHWRFVGDPSVHHFTPATGY